MWSENIFPKMMLSKSQEPILDCFVLVIFIEIAIVSITHTMNAADAYIDLLFNEFFKVKENEKTTEYQFYGENKKQLLMLADRPSPGILPDSDLALLTTIIENGLKMKLSELALFNLRGAAHDFEGITGYFKPSRMIIFGCDPFCQANGMHAALHTPSEKNGIVYLRA